MKYLGIIFWNSARSVYLEPQNITKKNKKQKPYINGMIENIIEVEETILLAQQFCPTRLMQSMPSQYNSQQDCFF